MLGRGAALVDHGAEPPRVALDECDGIEPESRKRARTENAVVSGRYLHECALFLAEPVDLVGTDSAYEVLQDSGAFVIGQLRSQIDVAGCF